MAARVRLVQFWYLYSLSIRQMRWVRLWLPFLIQALLAVILVLIHLYIFSPVTGPIIRSWLKLINAEFAGAYYHYPAQFSLLPYYFGNARVILNILTEAFLYGIVLDLLIALYRGQRPAFAVSLSHAARRYFQLTVIWLVVIGVLFFVNKYSFVFIERVLGYSLAVAPRRQLVAEIGVRTLTVLIYSACIFLLPSVMAGGASFLQAIKRGFAIFGRHPFVAIGLVAIPYVIGLPSSLAAASPRTIVANFNPEMVFYLILVSIGVDIIVNFILVATSLKFYMDQST